MTWDRPVAHRMRERNRPFFGVGLFGLTVGDLSIGVRKGAASVDECHGLARFH